MAQLTFTNDAARGYLSNAFNGGVNIHCVFNGGGRHVIFIESRIGDMPWSVVRTIVVNEQDVFSIMQSANSQLFRFFTDSAPVEAETSPTSSSGGGTGGTPADPSQIIEPGTNGDGTVNTMQEVIGAFQNFPEGKTIQSAIEEISGGGLEDEDIENIFYPKAEDGTSE